MIGNKLKYLGVILLTGISSILYNEYFMWILFLAVLLLPLLLFGIHIYTCYNIKIRCYSDVHVVNKEEQIPLIVEVDNPTIFPIIRGTLYFTYKNMFSNQLSKEYFDITISHKTTSTMSCFIKSEYAGNLEITLMKVRFFDYLHLFTVSKRQKHKVSVAVLPRIIEMEEMVEVNPETLTLESDQFSPIRVGDDPSEVFAIREYREGDRLSRIHWKLTMKEDRLMIKDFSDPIHCSVLLFLNLAIKEVKKQVPRMDFLIEYAISMSYSLILSKQIHYFAWYDRKEGICQRVMISTVDDLYDAINGLLQSGGDAEDFDDIHAYLGEYPHQSYGDFYYITSENGNLPYHSLEQVKAGKKCICYANPGIDLSDPTNVILDREREELSQYGFRMMGI